MSNPSQFNTAFDFIIALVDDVDTDNDRVHVTDSYGRRRIIPLLPRRGGGPNPQVGETWIIDRAMGEYAFHSLLIADPPVVYDLQDVIDYMEDNEWIVVSDDSGAGIFDFLPITGGTLTGALYLSDDPISQDKQAVTKEYVDGGASAGKPHFVQPTEPSSPLDGALWTNPDEIIEGVDHAHSFLDPVEYITFQNTFGDQGGLIRAYDVDTREILQLLSGTDATDDAKINLYSGTDPSNPSDIHFYADKWRVFDPNSNDLFQVYRADDLHDEFGYAQAVEDTNGGVIWFPDVSGAGGIWFDTDGKKRLNWNDGSGNWNFMANMYHSTTGNVHMGNGDGPISFNIQSDAANPYFQWRLAADGAEADGDVITWDAEYYFRHNQAEFPVQVFIRDTEDASLTTDTGVLIIGANNADQVAIDNNEILARTTGGATATLFLQNNGGLLQIGNAGSGMTLKGPSDDLTFTESGDDWSILNTQQNNGLTIYDGSGGIRLQYNGSETVWVNSTTQVEIHAHLVPGTNNTHDLGVDGLEWNDLWIAGRIEWGNNDSLRYDDGANRFIFEIDGTDYIWLGDGTTTNSGLPGIRHNSYSTGPPYEWLPLVSSGRKYKMDIQDVDLEVLASHFDKLRLRDWEENPDLISTARPGERVMGAVAEEVYEFYPEAVLLDDEGDPDGLDLHASFFIPMAAKVKLMAEEIVALRSRLEVLEARV